MTAKLGANHDLSGIFQADRLLLNVVGAEDDMPVEVLATGGAMYGAKLTSVWGQSVTTTFSASYNNKGGNTLDSYDSAADRTARLNTTARHSSTAVSSRGRACSCAAGNGRRRL